MDGDVMVCDIDCDDDCEADCHATHYIWTQKPHPNFSCQTKGLVPGAFVEFLDKPLPPPQGVSRKKMREPAWRPAVFSHQQADGLLVFRWTDNRCFTRVSLANLQTYVRKPQDGVHSQAKYVAAFGELC